MAARCISSEIPRALVGVDSRQELVQELVQEQVRPLLDCRRRLGERASPRRAEGFVEGQARRADGYRKLTGSGD